MTVMLPKLLCTECNCLVEVVSDSKAVKLSDEVIDYLSCGEYDCRPYHPCDYCSEIECTRGSYVGAYDRHLENTKKYMEERGMEVL